MSVSKEKKNGENTGKWIVHCRYTDWQGNKCQKFKRGFLTKKEALEWEKSFILKSNSNITMRLGDFVDIYLSEMKPKLKYNTFLMKRNIIETHILPYLANISLSSITPSTIVNWQNSVIESGLKNGKGFSPTYLRSINSQLSAIFNYACKFYGLPHNPIRIAGSMGKKKTSFEMKYWTSGEFEKFCEIAVDDDLAYCIFRILFYTGCRLGELLALTPADFNFKENTMSISKSYQRLKGEDVITTPKTNSSIRKISIPQFLSNEIQDYISSVYKIAETDRIFQISKSALSLKLKKYANLAGLKPIRIHDLRHSAATYYLYELGANAITVSKLLGHEKISLTLDTYTHNDPKSQKILADLADKQVQNSKT